MTRSEHVKWAKARALEYAEQGDLQSAWASICSDLLKHPETTGHAAMQLGTSLFLGGHLSQKKQMVDFIEGIQ
jgi:hypothetical protein